MPETSTIPTLSPEMLAAIEAHVERRLAPVRQTPTNSGPTAEPPTWSESLLTWKHQGLAVNVLIWSALGCLLQRVIGTTSYEHLIESLTTAATALGYGTPGALLVAIGCAIKARRTRA